jgi:hypothetical protein
VVGEREQQSPPLKRLCNRAKPKLCARAAEIREVDVEPVELQRDPIPVECTGCQEVTRLAREALQQLREVGLLLEQRCDLACRGATGKAERVRDDRPVMAAQAAEQLPLCEFAGGLWLGAKRIPRPGAPLAYRHAPHTDARQ